MMNLFKRTHVALGQQSPTCPYSRYSFSRITSALMAGFGIGLVLAAISTIGGFLPRQMTDNDFAFAYVSGRILREGRDPYSANLMEYNSAEKLPFKAEMGQATNPPLLLWLYQALPLLRPATAFTLWVAIEVLSVWAIFLASWHLITQRWSAGAWILALGLTICSMPMFHHFWFSQVQLPILAVLMTGFWLWRRGHTTGACCLFILAGVSKLYALTSAPFPVLAASGRSRRVLATRSLVFLVFWALLPGVQLWVSFFHNAAPYLSQFGNGRFASYTILSFVKGLLTAPYGSSPPILVARIASLLSPICVAALLLYTWSRCALLHEASDPENANACFCLLLIATVLCSPVAWAHYLVFLIFPLLCIAAEAKAATGRTRLRLGVLLMLGLITANLAGSNLLPHATGLLRHLGGSVPTLGMALLYCHFVSKLNQSTGVPRPSASVVLGR